MTHEAAERRRFVAQLVAAAVLTGEAPSLEELGRRVGCSGERVRQIIADLGLAAAYRTARREQAALEQKVRERTREEERELAEEAWFESRARCDHCQRVLHRRPLPDGRPSFCLRTPACRAARMRDYNRRHREDRARWYRDRRRERRELQRGG